MKIALLIPTYNEAANISTLLEQVAAVVATQSQLSMQVMVIDDQSPDGTAQFVQQARDRLSNERFEVTLLARTQKEGLGRAYIAGFEKVLQAGDVDFVIQMDADLSHDPHALHQFFSRAQAGIDLVVASRYRPGAAILNWAWYRRFLSAFGNRVARFFLGKTISDYTGGFNMYSVKVLRQMNLAQCAVSGYGFLIQLKFLAARAARQIEEFPIVFRDRIGGQSKMPLSTAFHSLYLVIRLWLQK